MKYLLTLLSSITVTFMFAQNIESEVYIRGYQSNESFDIEVSFMNISKDTIIIDNCLAPNITINEKLAVWMEVSSEGSKKVSPACNSSFSNINVNLDEIDSNCRKTLSPNESLSIFIDLFKNFELLDLFKSNQNKDIIIGLYIIYRFQLNGKLNKKVLYIEWKINKDRCGFTEIIGSIPDGTWQK